MKHGDNYTLHEVIKVQEHTRISRDQASYTFDNKTNSVMGVVFFLHLFLSL